MQKTLEAEARAAVVPLSATRDIEVDSGSIRCMQVTCESPETSVAAVCLALLFLAYLVVDLTVYSYTFARKLR